MADKYHSDTQEKIETIIYQPGLQDTGDLEIGTKTITATSKPAVPDYTANLTIPNPPARLTVRRLGLRLQVTIDSIGGSPAAIQLSYSVEVNGVERLAGSWNSTGAQYATVDLSSDQFSLGTANEIKVYLWVDQGDAVVSLCQAWLGVGTCNAAAYQECLRMYQNGLLAFEMPAFRVGTGTVSAFVRPHDWGWGQYGQSQSCTLSRDYVKAMLKGTVATDLNYVSDLNAMLRSLQ